MVRRCSALLLILAMLCGATLGQDATDAAADPVTDPAGAAAPPVAEDATGDAGANADGEDAAEASDVWERLIYLPYKNPIM